VYRGFQRPRDADEWLRIWTYWTGAHTDVGVPQGGFVEWKSAYDIIEEETAYECPICTSSDGRMYTTKCGHKFHRSCMKMWEKKKPRNAGRTCPMCRADL
jgi:hypothetical protein